jgi:hypothetical protein
MRIISQQHRLRHAAKGRRSEQVAGDPTRDAECIESNAACLPVRD